MITPSIFICPLSSKIMIKPVTDTCGHTFSEFHIINYFAMRSRNGFSCICPIIPENIIFIDELAKNTLLEYAIINNKFY